jgi:hypothetical protein
MRLEELSDDERLRDPEQSFGVNIFNADLRDLLESFVIFLSYFPKTLFAR